MGSFSHAKILILGDQVKCQHLHSETRPPPTWSLIIKGAKGSMPTFYVWIRERGHQKCARALFHFYHFSRSEAILEIFLLETRNSPVCFLFMSDPIRLFSVSYVTCALYQITSTHDYPSTFSLL